MEEGGFNGDPTSEDGRKFLDRLIRLALENPDSPLADQVRELLTVGLTLASEEMRARDEEAR